jgi:hypothetical protein
MGTSVMCVVCVCVNPHRRGACTRTAGPAARTLPLAVMADRFPPPEMKATQARVGGISGPASLRQRPAPASHPYLALEIHGLQLAQASGAERYTRRRKGLLQAVAQQCAHPGPLPACAGSNGRR